MTTWWKLFASLGICFLVAFAGSQVTTPSINTWYQTLIKPTFNPPNWIFGPVWSVLYLLMGISLFLMWHEKLTTKTKPALAFFALQLFLNFLWSFVFFYLHMPLLAFVIIIGLWLAIFMAIRKFEKVNKLAAKLLIPYLLWVSFATLLNFAIVLLN